MSIPGAEGVSVAAVPPFWSAMVLSVSCECDLEGLLGSKPGSVGFEFLELRNVHYYASPTKCMFKRQKYV